jgi:prolyl 4-hydroxylase
VHLYSEGTLQPSRIYTDEIGYIDTNLRNSDSAELKRDDVVRRIEKRARKFMGWRKKDTGIQPLKVQRYGYNGFYSFHYDWIDFEQSMVGNRMTTIMVYIMDEKHSVHCTILLSALQLTQNG